MISRADLSGALPVGAIDPARPIAPVGDARQELFDRLSKLEVGKQFQAQIMSRLTDGSFTVKLSADLSVRMNLPAGTQVGDQLDLTLLANQPRPTFLLGAPAADADASLSQAGRLIDNLLRAAQREGAPAALTGKTPVVPSPAASTTQVASALKDTLTFSGLFYESHVGQWASGDRPLADLLREPQAKNSSPILLELALPAKPAGHAAPLAAPQTNTAAPQTNMPAPDAGSGDAARLVEPARLPQPGTGQAEQEEGPAVMTSRISGSPAIETKADAPTAVSVPAGADTATSAATMDSESVRMISLQLNALEQQRVVWQGELWPGQRMEWEVTKDAPHGKVPDAERAWQSVVRFELPALGAVAASIRLAGGRLQVQVRAAEENTALLLREHGDRLASALDDAGSPLDLLTVKRDESI